MAVFGASLPGGIGGTAIGWENNATGGNGGAGGGANLLGIPVANPVTGTSGGLGGYATVIADPTKTATGGNGGIGGRGGWFTEGGVGGASGDILATGLPTNAGKGIGGNGGTGGRGGLFANGGTGGKGGNAKAGSTQTAGTGGAGGRAASAARTAPVEPTGQHSSLQPTPHAGADLRSAPALVSAAPSAANRQTRADGPGSGRLCSAQPPR